MKSNEADRIIRNYEQAAKMGDDSGYVDCSYAGLPRWRLTKRWVEFECGCTSERRIKLNGMQPWDPVIFVGLPEQAVYFRCCDKHRVMMDFRIGMSGIYKDFPDWLDKRRKVLMGTA